MSKPDFLIIGAMKCGTSTLQAQLAAQDGIFMTDPKEPNFFSDDDIYAQGIPWYKALYNDALPSDLTGEASTHYTKLPTYPDCVARLADHVQTPKLVYLIRNPVARAKSHFVHEWTMGNFKTDADTALDAHPEMISYGQYATQVAPFIDRFGAESILMLSLEDMRENMQATLDRVGAHIGHAGPMLWQDDLSRMNAGNERTRRFPLHRLVFDNPLATWARRTFVPQGLRDKVKAGRQMQAPPSFSDTNVKRLEQLFADDFDALQKAFPQAVGLEASYPFVKT